MDRAELLGLGKTDEEIEAEEAKARKEASERFHLRESLQHRQQMWRLRHDASRERWKARASAVHEMLDEIAGGDGGETLVKVLVPFCIALGILLLSLLIWEGVANRDPQPADPFYVHKTTYSTQGVDRYVVKRSQNWNDPTLSSAMMIDEVVVRVDELNAEWREANPEDKRWSDRGGPYYHDKIGETGDDCFAVYERVRWEDDVVSGCYATFDEAVVERDRLLATRLPAH